MRSVAIMETPWNLWRSYLPILEELIQTTHGPVCVVVYGDQEKFPLITYPDVALNRGKTAAEDDSGIASVPQPTTEAQVRRVSTSSISSGYRVAGRAASSRSHHVTEASPVGLQHLSLNCKTSTQASKAEVLVIQPPKLTNPTLQGKLTAGSITCSPENDASIKSLSKGRFNGHTAEINDVQQNEKCLKETMPSSPNREPCANAEMKSEVRKSSRLLADRRTSLEKAVELKKIRSLEKSKAPESSRQGSGSVEQADLARAPYVVKQAPATANCRVPRPSVARSSCTSFKVSQVVKNNGAKACQFGHNPVPKMSTQSSREKTSAIPLPDAVSPDILSQELQKTSAASSENKVPAVLAMATASPKTSTHASQRISARCSNDKGLIASPAILPPFGIPVKGKRSALSITEVKTDADVTKSPSKKSNTVCATKQNNVPEKVQHKDDRPKHKKQHNTKTEHINKDSTHSSLAKKNSARPFLQQKPTHHIKSGELFGNPPLEPLGERCHLCGIDLAFTQNTSDSRHGDLPFSAVLPCSHSYHDSCLNDLFGPCEPPCVLCLEG